MTLFIWETEYLKKKFLESATPKKTYFVVKSWSSFASKNVIHDWFWNQSFPSGDFYKSADLSPDEEQFLFDAHDSLIETTKMIGVVKNLEEFDFNEGWFLLLTDKE